jgi:hypothetical protein
MALARAFEIFIAMILDTMTIDEVARHLLYERVRNLPRILNKAHHICKKLSRQRIPTFHYEQLTVNHTRLTVYVLDSVKMNIIVGAWSRRDRRDWYGVMFKDLVVSFSDHFFERYAQRHLGLQDFALDQVVIHFFRDMKDIYWHFPLVEEDQTYMDTLQPFANGIGKGNWHPLYRHLVLYTFVAYSQLFKKQREEVLVKRTIERNMSMFENCIGSLAKSYPQWTPPRYHLPAPSFIT